MDLAGPPGHKTLGILHLCWDYSPAPHLSFTWFWRSTLRSARSRSRHCTSRASSQPAPRFSLGCSVLASEFREFVMCVCHQSRVKQLPVLLMLAHTLSATLSCCWLLCHTGTDLDAAYWSHFASVAGLFGVKSRLRLSRTYFLGLLYFQGRVSTGFI